VFLKVKGNSTRKNKQLVMFQSFFGQKKVKKGGEPILSNTSHIFGFAPQAEVAQAQTGDLKKDGDLPIGKYGKGKREAIFHHFDGHIYT
jgi:hypothetical protein